MSKLERLVKELEIVGERNYTDVETLKNLMSKANGLIHMKYGKLEYEVGTDNDLMSATYTYYAEWEFNLDWDDEELQGDTDE